MKVSPNKNILVQRTLYWCSNWKIRKSVEARGLRWTITDTALSPDQRFLLYASISSKVHLVNVGSNHDQVVSIANITEIHEELDFRGNQGSDYDGFAVWSLAWSSNSKVSYK